MSVTFDPQAVPFDPTFLPFVSTEIPATTAAMIAFHVWMDRHNPNCLPACQDTARLLSPALGPPHSAFFFGLVQLELLERDPSFGQSMAVSTYYALRRWLAGNPSKYANFGMTAPPAWSDVRYWGLFVTAEFPGLGNWKSNAAVALARAGLWPVVADELETAGYNGPAHWLTLFRNYPDFVDKWMRLPSLLLDLPGSWLDFPEAEPYAERARRLPRGNHPLLRDWQSNATSLYAQQDSRLRDAGSWGPGRHADHQRAVAAISQGMIPHGRVHDSVVYDEFAQFERFFRDGDADGGGDLPPGGGDRPPHPGTEAPVPDLPI